MFSVLSVWGGNTIHFLENIFQYQKDIPFPEPLRVAAQLYNLKS